MREIIETENIKEEETRKFIADSFDNGSVKVTGTDVAKILPPISRFGKKGSHDEKRKTVLEKLLNFFDTFFGMV